jgi:hypothetical protein
VCEFVYWIKKAMRVVFDLGPILVASTATPEQALRHVYVRAAIADRIEAHDLFRGLQLRWGDAETRMAAAGVHPHFLEYAASSGSKPEDLVFLAGGTVGTKVLGRNVLDGPTPPATTTLRIDPFVDHLLAGEATLYEFASLMREAQERDGLTDVDATSPRPLGSTTRHVEIRLDPVAMAMREPLEASLRALASRWGSSEIRQKEAAALVDALKLGLWPWLAADLVRRYLATLESIIRGTPWQLEYRTGDPRRGGVEPDGLAIPAFEPSGDAVSDRTRLAKWQTRLDEVLQALDQANRAGIPTVARTRRPHANELDGYGRDVGWLFDNIALGVSLRDIAERDFPLLDRWRDVQRGVNRARRHLSLADIYWPTEHDDARSG